MPCIELQKLIQLIKENVNVLRANVMIEYMGVVCNLLMVYDYITQYSSMRH